MFNRIIKRGEFILPTGVRSQYNYDYGSLSDTMNAAYCLELARKLEKWTKDHRKFDVVAGIETQGIRIGFELSRILNLPFHILPHQITEMLSLDIPSYPKDTHWLIVDDIVTTGMEMIRAVNYLEIPENPDSITFACMIRRNPKNLDYSHLKQDPHWEQFFVPQERYDFVDKRLVYLLNEPEA